MPSAEGEERVAHYKRGYQHATEGKPVEEGANVHYKAGYNYAKLQRVADGVERVTKRVDAITATKLTPTKHYLESHHVYTPRGGKEVKAQAYDVHHEGKHLGTVSTYTAAARIRGFSDGKERLRWSADPPEGKINGRRVESSTGHGARWSAVDQLKRWHGIE